MSSVTIDRPREADYPEWRRLYQGYADFYRVPMDHVFVPTSGSPVLPVLSLFARRKA